MSCSQQASWRCAAGHAGSTMHVQLKGLFICKYFDTSIPPLWHFTQPAKTTTDLVDHIHHYMRVVLRGTLCQHDNKIQQWLPSRRHAVLMSQCIIHGSVVVLGVLTFEAALRTATAPPMLCPTSTTGGCSSAYNAFQTATASCKNIHTNVQCIVAAARQRGVYTLLPAKVG